MTITEQKAMLEAYLGKGNRPPDFEPFWKDRWEQTVPQEVKWEPVAFHNSEAVYMTLTIRTSETAAVHARYIRPAKDGTFPTVFMFHDLERGIRGWHHMTRFIAMGYAVVALENRTSSFDCVQAPNHLLLEGCYTDALAVARVVTELPQTDTDHLVAWGEGFGGGLAMVMAAIIPFQIRCAVLNPLPADFCGNCEKMSDNQFTSLDYLDIANFAPMLRGSFLMGTGLLDQVAPPRGQYAAFNHAVCEKKHLVYPKYGHERINFFENELVKFLHF